MAFSVALVAMPWPLADRPSIQLATLKAYLDQRYHGAVSCRAYHPYLAVAESLGWGVYKTIANRSWLAEAVYAPLLFPDQLTGAEQLFGRLWPKHEKKPFRLQDAIDSVRSVHQRQHLAEELSGYDLVGISVCFSQLTSSLYLARSVKERCPEVKIVLGGSMVCEELGRSLMSAFPQIDYVINGEGERPLSELVDCLRSGNNVVEKKLQGLFWRSDDGEIAGGGRQQVASLDSLPIPDYHDFFKELHRCRGLGEVVVHLPVEASRGCWWHRATPQSPENACQFCNLNLQWKGYRSKAAKKTAKEIDILIDRYKSLRVVFVDNTPNPANMDEMFRHIEAGNKSLHLFSELRVPLNPAQVRQMRAAGLQQVQIGIEALSTRLLTKMGKGTTAIDNIAAMKLCEQYGINNLSNILLEFPGSDEEDVTQTLEALEFVTIYQPLRAVSFWLGEGSPVSMNPKAFNIDFITNHRWYKALFPPHVLNDLCLLVKEYRGDRKKQRRLWRPVKRRLNEWTQYYVRFKQTHFQEPMLGYGDGGGFLIVRRRKADSHSHEAYRLSGRSREVYLACEMPRGFDWLARKFAAVPVTTLKNFLNDLIDKRIMYREGDTYLSLAVNEDIRRFCAKNRDQENSM